MDYKGLEEYYQEQVDSELITVKFVEDEDVRQMDFFVQGWFNPSWLECGEETPILVELIVYINADVPEEDMGAIDEEFIKTVNHEMVHLEQFEDGRFFLMSEEEREEEAYSKESMYLNLKLIEEV